LSAEADVLRQSPVIAYNVQRLREISVHDAVSFHISGTEAVMQAVRLARYYTKRSHIVRFAGADHDWWGEVQPGIGNPTRAMGQQQAIDSCFWPRPFLFSSSAPNDGGRRPFRLCRTGGGQSRLKPSFAHRIGAGLAGAT
jgi:hypothetical protein